MLEFLGIPALWDQVVDFFTISAFWFYLFYAIAISAALIFVGWVFPPLRTFAGAIVIAMAVGLFGYRRGEKDAELRERERLAREVQRQSRREQQKPFKWPWDAAIVLLGISLMLITPALAESGIASVYTTRENGTRTASGKTFSDHGLTAAHRSLRFGTKVKVTHARNGRSVVVVITDRGPFVKGRIIDLSTAAARQIGLGYSVAPVHIEVVGCVPRLSGAALVGC